MNVNQQFILDVVGNFHKALSERADLCKDCRSEFNVGFYKKKAYQELYGARYIPAYYFEYCVLASLLYERVRERYRHLNVTSLGCGLSPDYYALEDNLEEVAFSYTGYDQVEWSSQKHMPSPGSNHHFVFENITNLSASQIAETDVYVFPKSIGDIGTETIEELASKIGATKRNTLFFLNSYVTKEYNRSFDHAVFLPIHKELLDKGFTCKDDPEKTFFRKGRSGGPGLRGINSGFLYPQEKIIACTKKEDGDQVCDECLAAKQPIFTNRFMCFSLLEYERK